MKKSILFSFMFCFLSGVFGAEVMNEDVRIQNVFAKIRRGENVKVAVMGGSITTGFNSNPIKEKSWAALTEKWFKELGEKTGAKIIFENRGVSGTDSAFGVARLDDHIIKNNYDMVILEFAMNDQWLEANVRDKTYEAIIRKIMSGTETAMLCLFVNERKAPYPSQESTQKPICDYYNIPTVSWKNCLSADNKISDFEIFFDGTETVHPNNAGHESIASYIILKLQSIWDNLPADKNIPKVEMKLPPAKNKFGYENTVYYHKDNINPVSNVDWKNGSPVHNEWVSHGAAKQGWQSNVAGAEIVFEIEASSIGVTYAESDQFRDCVAWVTKPDGTDTEKIPLKCFSSGRKGYLGWAYKEIISGNEIQKYKLHIQVSRRAPRSSEGKYANITGILAAK